MKLTFLFLSGGTAESSGGLADTVYVVPSRSAMESIVEQEVSELGSCCTGSECLGKLGRSWRRTQQTVAILILRYVEICYGTQVRRCSLSEVWLITDRFLEVL